MILKASAKKRMNKKELIAYHQRKEEEKAHLKVFAEAEAYLNSVNIKMVDVPAMAKQNQDMLQFMKVRGIIDEKGNPKAMATP